MGGVPTGLTRAVHVLYEVVVQTSLLVTVSAVIMLPLALALALAFTPYPALALTPALTLYPAPALTPALTSTGVRDLCASADEAAPRRLGRRAVLRTHTNHTFRTCHTEAATWEGPRP